jgi:hypothetical protein
VTYILSHKDINLSFQTNIGERLSHILGNKIDLEMLLILLYFMKSKCFAKSFWELFSC